MTVGENGFLKVITKDTGKEIFKFVARVKIQESTCIFSVCDSFSHKEKDSPWVFQS